MSNEGYNIRTGVTESTWRSMIIDVGAVYVNYGLPTERRLGATNGGVTFGWADFNIRAPEIDGLKGRLAGTTRITQASPQITVNLVEWNRKNMELSFPGSKAEWDGDKGMYVIKRSDRVIPLSDYPQNLAVVGTQSGTGSAVVMMIKLPQVTEGAEIPLEDDDEATADLTFVGHYDPADPEAEPWEIHWPEDSMVGLSVYTVQDGDSAVTVAVDLHDTSEAYLSVFDEDEEPALNVTAGDSLQVSSSGVYSVPLEVMVEQGETYSVRAYEGDQLEREIAREAVVVKEAP